MIIDGSLNSEAIRSILLEPLRWYETFRTVQDSKLTDKNSTVISLGLERCVPPSLLRDLSQQVVHLMDHDLKTRTASPEDPGQNFENDIAVVGMACKVAGADDLEDFWRILCEGKSQHQEVPSERFTFDTTHRVLDSQRKWYGNFINDHDKFDHKFFKKTPREAVSMDPQQRQILQVAYQAVQQSGYFHKKSPDRHVGCYVGVCSTDYEDNIACHEPTAYSATGHLRGFIAGKVSHYFGWTGPGLTIDTACSSSLVAVHQACRAILGGDCTSAVAGGSHVMSSPLWYQNLAGASFLSKTGSCKPFDANADGYCRGEGVAAIYLKKLSAARADGDHIIGVIAATAVQQNQNCTPIVVPNVPSLSGLFKTVLEKARLKPEQITVVEAHGTGTPVGDPAEFESVRAVLGASQRSSFLEVGSVKGLVGHCECTSGIVSLIKILLMIQEGAIPPQASFQKLNPAIQLSQTDRIQISTTLNPWKAGFRAALINNYGASGSNASLVVTQAPDARMSRSPLGLGDALTTSASSEHPLRFSGLDDRSLRAYIAVFRKYLQQKKQAGKSVTLSDLAFSLSRQSNPSLERSIMFKCYSMDELERRLHAYEKEEPIVSSLERAELRPLVLCFGGQVSTYVGLDRQVYEKTAILRKHLGYCNSYCISLGVGSIFPDIFQRTAIEDPIKLQTCLFALQYSCAKCWMDSGAQPAAVVGHSFGELTSLCIAGALSLEDTLKMIVSRARIIREFWSAERGAMMAVEGDLDNLQQLLGEANQTCANSEPAVIACYNGPMSFTIAGSNQAVNAVGEAIRNDSSFSSMRSKKLNVTHAFHSTLVDPLIDALNTATKGLALKCPQISMARCTETACEQKIAPGYFANHLRMPVYFNHSVQRLSQQFPHCIWLEAGSNSTITNMASRALSLSSGNHFQSINITTDSGWTNLTDATLNLWKAGLNVSFWAHHHTQANSFAPLLLPPYQFEQSRHWLELRKPPQKIEPSKSEADLQGETLPETLTTFVGYLDGNKRCARFRVNTMIPQYEELMRGHVVAYTAPILPLTVQMDLAADSLKSILPPGSQLQPQIQDVQNEAPICIDKSLSLWLDLEALDHAGDGWNFKFSSTDPLKPNVSIKYSKGKILLRSPEDLATHLDFVRYKRLTGHSRCTEILNDSNPSNVIQGRTVYKTFSEVVDYSKPYQGLQKVVGKGQMSAARVLKGYNSKTYFDAYLSDTFCQVIGIWINYMTDRASNTLYIAKGFDKWVRSPKLDHQIVRPEAYDLLAYHQGSLENGFVSDLFIFHPVTGELLEFVLGFQFVKVAKASLIKLLLRLTREESSQPAPLSEPVEISVTEDLETGFKGAPAARKTKTLSVPKVAVKKKNDFRAEIMPKVIAILTELSGVEAEQIKESTELANIGIDSLMGMELISEIERNFKCSLPEDDIAQVTDVAGVLRCIQAVVGPRNGTSETEDSEEESAESVFDGSSAGETDISTSTGSLDIFESTKGTPLDLNHIIPTSKIFEAFKETKSLTDQFIADGGCGDYIETILGQQNNLCIGLTLDAFEQMGCSIRSAKAGEEIKLFKPRPEHVKLIRNLCEMLDKVAGIIKVDGSTITRTEAAYPISSGADIMKDLSKTTATHQNINKLIYYVGSNLADVLNGKIDGVKLIFGRAEGRELVSSMYGDWIMNRPCYKQMEDFLSRLISSMSAAHGPIKILEMGAGTGGTTKWLVPMLATLDHPVEYTFTDLSPSFVAAARKKYKAYPFMKFEVHDIEKEPASDLLNKHHIVIASNAVHATHSLQRSATNIKKALLPNGILMMLEMIEPLYWVDMIFGLFEGWWLFEDGREHALTPVARWKTDLQAVGFGYVDWSDGMRPETNVNKVIVAVACEPNTGSWSGLSEPVATSTNELGYEAAIEEYVRKNTLDFIVPNPRSEILHSSDYCVLVTGATGSTGSHLVASLASRANVKSVVCLNRRSNQDPKQRQLEAFASRGINLSQESLAKLYVLETDTAKPTLGLSGDIYQGIVNTVTHIIHNAWPMSIKRPLKGFENQFRVMRNLIDLARDASGTRSPDSKVNFELVSSVAVVGQYPILKNTEVVPETRTPVKAIMPIGYANAKYVCEVMLDRTLHQHPDRFRACVVRLGQIAGSKSSGYWNPAEHLSFIWKSAQTLNALPALTGPLSWTPVDDVAGTLADLVLTEAPHPIYNIDNPVRQPWEDMLPVIADALRIPRSNIVPFLEWVQIVRSAADCSEKENPAAKLGEFFEQDFLRMACGGLLLDTTKAREHSATLRAVAPVSAGVAEGYFAYWKKVGFLT